MSQLIQLFHEADQRRKVLYAHLGNLTLFSWKLQCNKILIYNTKDFQCPKQRLEGWLLFGASLSEPQIHEKPEAVYTYLCT